MTNEQKLISRCLRLEEEKRKLLEALGSIADRGCPLAQHELQAGYPNVEPCGYCPACIAQAAIVAVAEETLSRLLEEGS